MVEYYISIDTSELASKTFRTYFTSFEKPIKGAQPMMS